VFRTDTGWALLASDLVDAYECDHRSALVVARAAQLTDARFATGLRDDVAIEHGLAHESRVLDRLKQVFKGGLLEIGSPAYTDPALRAAADQTDRAMDTRAAVVVRGVFYDGYLSARAALLIRADLDPTNGSRRTQTSAPDLAVAVAYEPYAIELGRHAHPGAVLQLATCRTICP
jgi:hypothetical protein